MKTTTKKKDVREKKDEKGLGGWVISGRGMNKPLIKVLQGSENIRIEIWQNDAITNIKNFDIYMDYSYIYGFLTQD